VNATRRWLLKVAIAFGFAMAAWLGVLVVGGIAVVPHMANLSPRVLGELSGASGPMAAAPVKVAVQTGGGTCGEPSATATSQANGRFAIEPIRELRWLVVVMAHRKFQWDLCVMRDGQWLLAKPHDDYTLVDTGPAWVAIVRCRLEGDPGTASRFGCEEGHDWDATEESTSRWLASSRR